MAEEMKPGRYRHFKGKEYQVLGVARHSETLEPMVVYKALYDEGSIWVRPASMWNEMVERDGQLIPRFAYIGEEPMLLIGYPGCTTCQKARNWLDANQLAYDLRNVKEQKPTAEELRTWYAVSGLPLKKFFNTSGMLYKERRLKDQLPGMSEEEQIALLASDGMLVKRPLLIGNGFVLVGFQEDVWRKTVVG